LSGDRDEAAAVTIQRDGKILVAGGAAQESKFALVRYNADGSLDPSFGTGGEVTVAGPNGPLTLSQGDFGDVAEAPDGKILAAGNADGFRFHTAVVDRFNADGTLDTEFEVAGLAGPIAFQTDGKVLVGLTRYNPDGTFDPTFHA